MLKELILFGLFRPMLIAGELTCPNTNWILHESICYKAVISNFANGTRKCHKEYPESKIEKLKTSKEADLYSSLFPDLRLWAGLEFYMGFVWKWKDDSEYDEYGTILWAVQPYNPSLCVGIGYSTGLLYDQICSFHQGVLCQKDIGNTGSCEYGWVKGGFLCYKLFRQKSNGEMYNQAWHICWGVEAELIMPKSVEVGKWISNTFSCSCWIGLTDYDADGIYIWNDGILENISNMYWSLHQSQPDRREKNYICAYVFRGELYDDDCSSLNYAICQVNATEQLSTLFGISSNTASKSFLDTSTTDASRTSSMLSLVPGGTTISGEMSTTLRTTYTNGSSTADETTTVAKLTQHRVTCTNQCKCLWNYTDQSDNKQTYLPYKVDKKSLSSFRGRRQCARDYRKSALYLGVGGITVLVLFPLFIIILDFLPGA